MAKRSERVEAGSGNVFRDLDLGEPEERQLRTRLALQINDLVAEHIPPKSYASPESGNVSWTNIPHWGRFRGVTRGPLAF